MLYERFHSRHIVPCTIVITTACSELHQVSKVAGQICCIKIDIIEYELFLRIEILPGEARLLQLLMF